MNVERPEQAIAEDFIRSRPGEAARVLEKLPAAARTELLNRFDGAVLGRLFEWLVPSVAAQELERLPRERTASIVGSVSRERATAILRCLDAGATARVLETLDDSLSRDIELQLQFPPETAGAWMEPNVTAFHQARHVHDVVESIRRGEDPLRYYVFTVDDAHRLTGVVSVRELLTAAPDAELRTVANHPVESLSANAGRTAVLKHPGWRRFPVLPVVDAQERLVGIFRYETLQSLRKLPSEDGPSTLELALAFGELFWLGASSVLRGLERMDDEQSG